MHLDHGEIPTVYKKYINQKILLLIISTAGLVFLGIAALSAGSVSIPLSGVIKALLGQKTPTRWSIIIWNIRLPQILASIISGAGLAGAGVVMQAILRNPLGSPFTLGISQAAAFGAAFSVMIFRTGATQSSVSNAVMIGNQYVTTVTAFVFCIAASLVILLISRLKRGSPEVMVLAGVALGSLFTAGTMFLQYFADDVQLAAMVFWTFGDVARADWNELGVMTVVTGAAVLFFVFNAWNFNAVDAGDETALSLGVHVRRVRFSGMFMGSLVTAVIISFVGIIGFVGLVCPHMVRRIIGDDNRFLLPGSCIMGGALLLAADTAARLAMAPKVLPVAVLTSFVGAPVFLYLIIKGYRK